jgi:hypothetical protein
MIQSMKHFAPIVLGMLAWAVQSPAGQPVFACNLKAFQPDERKIHDRLTGQLKSGAIARRELPDGYSFQMDPGKVSIAQLAEWTVLERKCCPFFDYQLDLRNEENTLWFTLKGREGVKKFIALEVPWAQAK